MGNHHRRESHRRDFVKSFALELLRKIGVFILALLTAAAIMFMVTLPLMLIIWWILKYAAQQ